MIFYEVIKKDDSVKSPFVNDFEHFGGKALVMFSAKNCPAKAGFEGVSPSFSPASAGLNITSGPKMLFK